MTQSIYNNLEELEHQANMKLPNESTQSSQNIQQRFSNQQENQALHELCDLSSAKQARIASKEEAKKTTWNTIQHTLTITERMRKRV